MTAFSSFAGLVNELRGRQRLTVKQLAQLADVSPRTLESYLQGERRSMPAPLASELLKLLGLSKEQVQRAATIAIGTPFELDDEPLRPVPVMYGFEAPGRAARRARGTEGVGNLQYPLAGEVPLPEDGELPRALDILASEFEVEAMKAGADRHDMRYIRMALRSREATEIYHGGYQEPASDDEQRTEMENTIAMLRVWLNGRIKRRKPKKGS